MRAPKVRWRPRVVVPAAALIALIAIVLAVVVLGQNKAAVTPSTVTSQDVSPASSAVYDTTSAAFANASAYMNRSDRLQIEGLEKAIPYLMWGKSLMQKLSMLVEMWCTEASILGANDSGDPFAITYFQTLQRSYNQLAGITLADQPTNQSVYQLHATQACPGGLFTNPTGG